MVKHDPADVFDVDEVLALAELNDGGNELLFAPNEDQPVYHQTLRELELGKLLKGDAFALAFLVLGQVPLWIY